MVSLLSISQLFSNEANDTEKSRLRLEPMHLAAKLTTFQGLSFQEEYFLFLLIYFISSFREKTVEQIDRRTFVIICRPIDMYCAILSEVRPCSPEEVPEISDKRTACTRTLLGSCWSLARLTLRPSRWKQYVYKTIWRHTPQYNTLYSINVRTLYPIL
jgi:hypothetical protein